MKQRLKSLCELAGISGREEAVREYIVSTLQASPTEKEITVDPLGNVICNLKGKQRSDKKVLFAAHMDEVGLIVTHIAQDGFLHFATVGGIDPAVLCGRRVRMDNTIGVIGCKAVHLCDKEEAKKQPKTEDLRIDIGADNAQEAKKLVKVGEAAVFDVSFCEMQELVLSKALDDRAGCVLLLELAQQTPAYDITLAFTVQEEVGLRGAGPAAFSVDPDIAVIVETTTAADIADVPQDKQVCQIGAGPVVSFMDKATLYDAELYTKIRDIADTHSIPNQTKTVIAGGNDAGAIQRAAGGVRVAAVSLPCRYIHSPSCVLSMRDMEYTRQLLFKLTEELPQ